MSCFAPYTGQDGTHLFAHVTHILIEGDIYIIAAIRETKYAHHFFLLSVQRYININSIYIIFHIFQILQTLLEAKMHLRYV